MNSLILSRLNSKKSFLCLSANSQFVLSHVIVDPQSFNLEIKELKSFLSGFYLEVEEVYELDEKSIYSRSRPFELSKEIDSRDNSIHFNVKISNERFESSGVMGFYNKLNIKLISRYSDQYDLSFIINYKSEDIVDIESEKLQKE